MSKKARKRRLEGDDQSKVNCEKPELFSDTLENDIKIMWEIPQIYHFLHLTRDVLNTPHMSMYEMERMLAIPKASKQLANVMTCLLSSPITKAKVKKLPPMPYEFWTNILSHKVKSWFKVYQGKHQDAVKVLETIGVEPEFWNVFPDASLIDGKDFDDLSFKQRVWLLKTICDTIMHTRKTVQDEITKQLNENQFETILGTDRYGARYIYFSQFIESDIRIYRHCLDNNILSTVKPPNVKIRPKPEIKIQSVTSPKPKVKRRRLRWQNGFSGKTKRRVVKLENQITKRSNDDGSSPTKRARMDKSTDESALSTDIGSNSSRSSNYNSNPSKDNKSLDSSLEVFKGFPKCNEESCNIKVLSGILNDLSKEVDAENSNISNEISELENSGQTFKSNNAVESNVSGRRISTRRYFDGKEDKHSNDNKNSIERIPNDVSTCSKTDDEKLNEMIAAENSKLNEETSTRNSNDEKDNLSISIASKSDDEKLNETKTSGGLHENNWLQFSADDKNLNNNDNVKVEDEKMNQKFVSSCKSTSLQNNNVTVLQKSVTRKSKLRSRHTSSRNFEIDSESLSSNTTDNNSYLGNLSNFEDNDESSKDDKDSCINDLRSRFQGDIIDDSNNYSDDTNGTGYSLRKSKDMKTDTWKKEINNFNEMLIELGTSKFRMVVNNVETLRDLISHFSPKADESGNNCDSTNDTVPLCEIKLVRRLTELFNSVKRNEARLKEIAKKAKGKLQKEWNNFKEGVEDQDSSGDGGLSSNWWVIGSQGCPLPASGDATLSALPQSALSKLGAQSNDNQSERGNDNQDEDQEHDKCEEQQKCEEQESQTTITEKQGNDVVEGEKRNCENDETNEENDMQPRRILRARGVSSYNEQLYSDEEIAENELEEWTDVEAVYAAPGSQADTSTANVSQKVGHTDDRSEEDSDQDWILPSSRKRKNKRPSANRRLKSFQNKIQNIKTDACQDVARTIAPNPHVKVSKDKSKGRETKESHSQSFTSPGASSISNVSNIETVKKDDPKETVPSPAETICKIDSVHSELDIKDEGPIFDTVMQQYTDNNYIAQSHHNYVMLNTEQTPMNYYVMQPSPTITGIVQPQTPVIQPGTIVSGVMPPVQQGYYVQNTQNYIIHDPQTNFTQPAQPAFQQSQMIPPQFIGHPGYVPYVVNTTQSQSNCITSQIPKNQMMQQEIRQNTPSSQVMLRALNRTYNRFPCPRNFTNGAVIRSNVPVRGICPRGSPPKCMRNIAPRQRVPDPKLQRQPKNNVDNSGQKTTSLIVLSDSDDEIEMIITEKTDTEQGKSQSQRKEQRKQVPTVTSDITVATPKGTIPPQIIQRMSQGGISITPVKPAPVQNTSTQLVVVVNETGSHYALALPNGSKLILTPEQVAQIRASNGGKLIL